MNNASLGAMLRTEFEADCMSIKEASYDTETKSLQLQLSEQE